MTQAQPKGAAAIEPVRSSLEPGQVVRLRGRRGVIDDEPKWDPESGQHLVRVRYLDEDEPSEEVVLWERERQRKVISGTGYPRIGKLGPTDPPLYRAYLDAVQWSTSLAYPDRDQIFLAGPLRSSVLLHNYQLYALYKAMLMPSVRLFIADDVGLGKTIEAGLVLSELISQRGIRRILVVAPASLQLQWKDELRDKFHLDFTVLDRDQIHEVKQKDPNANAWMFHQRIIASMDFLKRPEVLDDFEASCRKLVPTGSGRFPWDLIIVDEVHHFAPQPSGEDTARIEMLQKVLPQVEHRIFLSATPHNGYPTSFTGLLSFLDPVRFQKSTKVDEATKAELRSVFIRRLKEDVNEEDPPPKFQIRAPPISLRSDPTLEEKQLFEALRNYDRAIRRLPGLTKMERSALRFVRSIFTKRLLSSPYAFARTWWAHRAAYAPTVTQARLSVDEAVKLTQHLSRARAATTADDTRADEIDRDASLAGGSVLQKHWKSLAAKAKAVDEALETMGLPREVVEQGVNGISGAVPDAKWFAFESKLAPAGGWLSEEGAEQERVIVFTEYRDTQEYLLARLKEKGVPDDSILTFYGGAPLDKRELIKAAFNDPEQPVRILLATDAASEGLNLQETCRFVVHHDLPWNPMRIDQRNGRVDRYGQLRQVKTWHHVLVTVEEFEFLGRVAEKAEQARKDLGRLAPLLEMGVNQALVADDDVDLGRAIESVDQVIRQPSQIPDLAEERASRMKEYQASRKALDRAQGILHLEATEMALVLGQALRLDGGMLKKVRSGIYEWDAPTNWEPHVKTLRRPDGARRNIVFDQGALLEEREGLQVLAKRHDLALVSMGHPVMDHAVRRLRRFIWDPGSDGELLAVTKWTVEDDPEAADIAVLSLLTVARNKHGEILREQVEHLAVKRVGHKFEPLDKVPAPRGKLTSTRPPDWYEALEPFTQDRMAGLTRKNQEELAVSLQKRMREARDNYEVWLKQSLGALEAAARQGARREVQRLDREIQEWTERAAQKTLDPVLTARNQWELDQRRKEKAELESLFATEARIKEQREHIEWEARKYLDEVFPQRYEVGHVETTVVGIRFTTEASP